MKAATIDGRPIAWQTIDWSRHHAVVLRKYVASGGGYDTIEVADPGFSYAWNALNSQGLANVGNGLRDLAPANWTTDIIPTIQRQCATVGDVRSYLSTIGGQYQVGVNIAVIDATGRVLDFEIGPSRFWEYDPENAQRQTQSFFQPPKLFVNRANRSFRNDQQQEIDAVVDTWDADDSKRRYRTARDLFVKYITNGDKLTIGEAANITRWGDPGHGKRSISGPHTIWGNIFLGVKAGEDPKYATMLVAMGYPDYSIYLPVWVDLSQAELSQRVKTWDAKNLAWWSFKLFDERFDNTEDYDNYINGIFKAVEDNIIDAVKMARDNWLVAGNSARFHDEAVVLHSWSASAAYYTIRSAYETAGSNGRSCNRPPEIASLNPVRNGLSVSLRCDATDPDGDGIAKYYWHFGDGTTSGATQQATQSHTYAVDGTYLVVCYAVDGRSSPAVNLKFAYVTVAGKHGGDARPDAGAIDGATDGAADGSPHAHDGGARALDGSTDAQTDGPPTTDTLPNDARADTGARVGDAAGGGDAGLDRGPETLGGGCATSGRGGQRAPDLGWLLVLVVLACPSARRHHSQTNRAAARSTRRSRGLQ